MNSPQPRTWEYFRDRVYYDMYTIRVQGDKRLSTMIHFKTVQEAVHACSVLNFLEREYHETQKKTCADCNIPSVLP